MLAQGYAQLPIVVKCSNCVLRLCWEFLARSMYGNSIPHGGSSSPM